MVLLVIQLRRSWLFLCCCRTVINFVKFNYLLGESLMVQNPPDKPSAKCSHVMNTSPRSEQLVP